jgi:hypothetical protein
MTGRQEEKERRRGRRLAAEEAQRRAGTRRRLLLAGGAAALITVALVVIVAIASSGGGRARSSSASPAASGLLASTAAEASGAAVDGIRCQTTEQAIFHIHAHLAVYAGGRPRLVPEGIGIPQPRRIQQTPDGPFVIGGACFYWLHSHARDGIIHIESPVRRAFTLGDYFDVWKQPLSRRQVGPARGRVTAYVDGRRYTRDPRSIPLSAHAVIQLDIGAPALRPRPFTFPPGL